MTDLNLVYGFPDTEPQQVKHINIKPVEQIQEPIQSHATPPEIQYQQNGVNAMNSMYMQQEGDNNSNKKYQPTYSFWDRMVLKRTDVMKLATFSLVFLMAIAIDRMGTHYINKYLTDNIFTDIQEFIIRLSYPILIFIVLWIVKSL